MNEDKNYQSMLQYALNLIAKKRYTQGEMEKKLRMFIEKFCKVEGEADGEAMNRVINRLIELKYLDDSKYAADYISDRAKFRPRGAFLLRNELKRKGIEKTLIDKVLDESELDEVKMAAQILEKKMKSWSKFEQKKIKEKSFTFLSGKGFKPDTIYKVVKQCYDPNAIEDL